MDGDRVIVALDLFPATVSVLSTTYSNVRIAVADGELQLWRLGGSGPELFYQRMVTGPIDGSASTGVSIPTDDGQVWAENSGDCGCGSLLKVADLWPGRQRVMTSLR